MNISGFLAALVLGPGLSAQAVMAQELVIPDRQRLQAMSHEEYDAYREQMRNRMNGLGPAEQNLMREPAIGGREQMEGRGYGQGYGARNFQGMEQDGMGNPGNGYGRGGGAGRRR